ncbi:maleylpyruvate isomerase family mycothiol-dependent enzyme [Prauserella oleivorans]|uniref:Maleylpyruvate isomerase family mycothiol-dependent enzyme n=1 Tax=Prauserella oleivorans TaxID=1478153 RepID=A0ABW5WER5_9PSEU
MTTSRATTATRTWMDESTALLLRTVDSLSEADFDAPSALPGWTRRHLVAHVHFNAEALRRLVSWARTGVENPMYPSVDHRNAEIEQGATLPPERLRELVHGSAAALAADLDALPDAAWRNEITTRQGRTIPATEIPWMRAVEAAVHTVDLGVGVDFADLPGDFVHALVEDTLAARLAQGHGPDLARWLTGRTSTAPALGPWL